MWVLWVVGESRAAELTPPTRALQLKECTFKPTTNHSRPRSRPAAAKNNDENTNGGGGYLASHKAKKSSASGKKPVVVRGLGRHLELRALADRKTKEVSVCLWFVCV